MGQLIVKMDSDAKVTQTSLQDCTKCFVIGSPNAISWKTASKHHNFAFLPTSN